MDSYIAVFDIGTTTIKGVLVDKLAGIRGEQSVNVKTYHGENKEITQDPSDWLSGIRSIANVWWSDMLIKPDQVTAITFCGQMEDLIPISHHNTYDSAILYSDTRAVQEADMINDMFPDIRQKTGNHIRSSTPLAKLSWLNYYQHEQYETTRCFVFSAKDPIIHRLTGSFVTDPTTAATTGMMNLTTRQWIPEIMKTLEINPDQLPAICNAEEVAGYVTRTASEMFGFSESTPVLCGSGDAGASTMGSAAVTKGDAHLYIGTTGWAALIQDEIVMNDKDINGLFNLAHLPEETIISIAPLLNAGNVHRWAVDTFIDENVSNQYLAFDQLISQSEPGSRGVLFLPYLKGERCPVYDPEAKGAFWGIGPDTQKCDMARAVIESICFSYKQTMNLVVDADVQGTLTLIGGGSKSEVWCQILADSLGQSVRVPSQNEYMPALGAAASAFVNLGWSSDYRNFRDRFLNTAEAVTYEPDLGNTSIYQAQYEQYLKLYPSMKQIYKS